MTTPTDEQLKQALAKLIPEQIYFLSTTGSCLFWKEGGFEDDDGGVLALPIGDTELLHLCWLVEQEAKKHPDYWWELKEVVGGDSRAVAFASWQQRVIALCKIKGIEI